MMTLIRQWRPGEYLMFDVNELPVYSALGHFRYAFTAICPVSQYRWIAFTSRVDTRDYLDFVNYIQTEIRQRLGWGPRVLYCDDFSTFHQQFEVAAAYSEFGVQCLSTPAEMHWLNGAAENSIRILTRHTRILLSQFVGAVVAGTVIRDPQPFWPLAMENARQLINSMPNSVNYKLYGVPLAPVQVLTGQVDTKVDVGKFHRFGDLAYVVDYVRDRAGKLVPVSYRGYYVFNPSWSYLIKKYCDMSKSDVILSERGNELVVTGMARYPNENVTHPRAYREPGIALREPLTSVRAHDAAFTPSTGGGGGHDVTDVIGRDGSRRTQASSAASQASARGDANRERDAPAAASGAAQSAQARGELQRGTVGQLHSGVTGSSGDPAVGSRGSSSGGGSVPSGTSTLPDRLPPPNVLRHHDLAIRFRPGAVKRGIAGDRFASYSKATTIAQFFNLGGRNADWNWDIAKGIVSFVDPQWQALAERSFGDARPQRGVG